MQPTVSVALDWAELAAATTAILGTCGIVALIVRALVAYLRRELVEPTAVMTHELTGGTEEPSLRELVDELGRKHDEHSGEIEDATLELRAMALMFDGHLEWAQREVDQLRRERQQAVDELWAELRRQREARLHPPAPGRHKRKDTRDDDLPGAVT